MTEPARNDSTRSCVGCRQTDDRDALMRFVLAGDPPTFVPDVRRRAGGRGVSVHPRYRCVEAAVRTGALRRGLKGPTGAPSLSARELADAALAQYEQRAQGLLLAARRAAKCALGEKAVREAMNERRVSLLVVATDAEGSREELASAAERLGRGSIFFGTKTSLGKLFGRDALGILAVLDSGIANELRSVVACRSELLADPSSSQALSAAEES